MRRTVQWPWQERRVDAAGQRHVWRTAAEVTAVGVTCLVLAVLAVLKVVIRPVWRASARRGLTVCMTGQGSGRSTDRVHLVGHLAGCLGRLEPVRSDYLELATAGLLVALLVVEVRLLARDRPPRATAVHPGRPALHTAEADRPVGRRVPVPRASAEPATRDDVERGAGCDGR